MDETQAIETAAIRSLTLQGLRLEDWRRRPYRAPHHTASAAALVGGGGRPRPGEISLAHNGVLFLDELPEFDRHVLEVLREPLESGHIVLSRAARQAEYPARFQLIAAMNPCPCGHLGEPRCRCAPERIEAYRSRVSGPLLDRIDLHVAVGRVAVDELARAKKPESSIDVAHRVERARARQSARQGSTNARLGVVDLTRCCMAEASHADIARARDAAACAIGACVPPHTARRAHDRRSRRSRNCRPGTYRGGNHAAANGSQVGGSDGVDRGCYLNEQHPCALPRRHIASALCVKLNC